jgi:C4-type Zn-finger protein
MRNDPQASNVNITLEGSDDAQNNMLGKFFPCPVCGASLGIRIARTQKPYCVCIDCGIQIFFRGKTGIARLKKIVENELLIAGKDSNASNASVLFNRIQHLKRQKTDLEVKQGLIIRDPDLKNAIRAVDIEIERVQGELEKLSRKTSREKTR